MIPRPLLDPNDVRDPAGTVAPPNTRMISEFIAAEPALWNEDIGE